jgi:uncharacterized protein
MGMLAVIVGVASFFGLTYYVRMWRTLRAAGCAMGDSPMRVGDGVMGILLGIWFVMLVAQSGVGDDMVVTRAAIASSAIIYTGLAGILVIFLVVRGIRLDEVFGVFWRRWRGDLPAVGIGLIAVLPVVLGAQWVGSLLGGGESQPLLDFWLGTPSWGDRLLVVVMALVVAPMCEEVIFRGYLFQVARRYVGIGWAVLAVSLLFAAIHVHLPAFLGLFVLAVALNLVYAKVGVIWAPTVMHSAFNALTLVVSLMWPDLAASRT